jgi:hypothetical protein
LEIKKHSSGSERLIRRCFLTRSEVESVEDDEEGGAHVLTETIGDAKKGKGVPKPRENEEEGRKE